MYCNCDYLFSAKIFPEHQKLVKFRVIKARHFFVRLPSVSTTDNLLPSGERPHSSAQEFFVFKQPIKKIWINSKILCLKEPFDSRAKTPPASRWEKGYGDENGNALRTKLNVRHTILVPRSRPQLFGDRVQIQRNKLCNHVNRQVRIQDFSAGKGEGGVSAGTLGLDRIDRACP